MMVVMFVIYIWICCCINLVFGLIVDDLVDVICEEKICFLGVGVLFLIIFVLMMVFFVNGWILLVESLVIGVLVVLVVLILKCCMIWEVFYCCIKQILGILCMFMWIIFVVFGFGVVFDGLGVVKVIEGLFIKQFGLLLWMILILMQFSFILMGIFLDDIVMFVIVVLFYVLLVGVLGFDLIWYGVFYMIMMQIVYMILFFGYNLFLMKVMVLLEISLCDIYWLILFFVLVMVFVLIVIMVFFDIVLWLFYLVYGI